MPEITLLNGRFISPRSAMVPVDDWAVRYGWGLFETLRISDGCPLFLDRHLARMCRTAPLLALSDNPDAEIKRWRKDVVRAMSRAGRREGVANCYWTRGAAPSGRRQSRIVRIRPMPRYPNRPLRLWVAPWRLEPTYPGTGVKTLAYFPYIFAGISARREGCDEAIILNSSDRIADCAASSIFLLKNNRLATPALDQGTLAGVTRGIVLEIARSLGIPHREARISWKMLAEADEVFVSSSLRGVVAVKEIKGCWKSKRVDKPVFPLIRHTFRKVLSDHISRWKQDG